MPHLTLPISPAGPLLDILVGVSHPREEALRESGQPIPPPVQVRGLVDTGASCSCMDPAVLTQLALSPTGSVSMMTPSTGAAPHLCDQYDVSITLIHTNLALTLNSIPVMESHLAMQGIQALIGRDVLSQCVLVYNGATAIYTLCF